MIPPPILAVLPTSVPLPALRTLVVGAEACPVELMTHWAQGRHFFNAYGPTEATVSASIAQCLVEQDNQQGLDLGRPLTNTQVYLLDHTLQPVPVGVPGEIYLGGIGLARGYLHKPETTAERFVPHPFAGTGFTPVQPGARLYRTGDMARFRFDGKLEFLGRVDRQVKIRGYRVELGEIEALLRSHPMVDQCAVVRRVRPGGNEQLVAYVTCRPTGQSLKQELQNTLTLVRTSLQDRLPAYMIPAVFVLLDTLPLLPNGKVDRLALSALEESNRLSLTSDSQTGQLVQPRDTIELQLVQIWEEVLQIQPVSVLDNFFTIGGHSLLAVRLMSHVAKHFGHHLDLATLFQHPTIAELAVVLRQQVTSDERSPVVALQPQGSRPPFFCVHPAGGTAFCYVNLARYLGPDQPFYGLHAPDRSRIEELVEQGVPSGTRHTGCTTIEELAASYVVAIQEVQPQGPYLLGGWSLGGIIAFEMARQLQQQGEEVGLLAVIDSRLPSEQMRAQARQEEIDLLQYPLTDRRNEENLKPLPALIDAGDSSRTIPNRSSSHRAYPDGFALGDRKIARELIGLAGIPVPDDFDQREPHDQFSYAMEQTKKMHVFPVDTSPEFVRHFARTSLLNKHMMSVYVPQKYQHRIDYFAASASLEDMNSLDAREDSAGSDGDSSILLQHDQLQRWRDLANDVKVHLIPGNHQDIILHDANVRELAHALKHCIDRAYLVNSQF